MTITESLKQEKSLRNSRKTIDVATEQMLEYASKIGIDTVFHRQQKYDETILGVEKSRCYFGSFGICCRQCAIGPCRIWHEDLPMRYKVITPVLDKGTCGASADTIVARNLLMMVARGTAAHGGHAKHVADALLKTAHNQGNYVIEDTDKLIAVANKLGIDTSLPKEKIAEGIAKVARMDIFGGDNNGNGMQFASAYLQKGTLKNLKELGVMPFASAVDLLDADHETSFGVMSDPTSLLLQAAKLGIADINSLIISTELQDILLGVPSPVESKINFNVLDKDKVNIVVHGHFPLLSEKIVEWSENEELIELARSVGADGINVVGLCCTGNEVLMRHGIPLVGSNLQQELAILTGLVDALVVDVQCIFPNLENVASQFHTKLITTMKEGRMTNAVHIPFKEENADESTKKIIETAIYAYKNRGNKIFLPTINPQNLIAGFSVESCIKALASINPEDPLMPIIDNIANGNIFGAVLLAGCTNTKITADNSHVTIAKELLKNNVLVIATGCAAQACARAGLLTTEGVEKYAGDKIKGVLKELGLPAVLHFGSCVDNSRVVVLLTALANQLGVQVKDLPIAASAAEWATEKAAAIGTGVVALGVTMHLGITPPVLGSPVVTKTLTNDIKELFGGKFIVEVNPEKAAELLLGCIREKREGLKI